MMLPSLSRLALRIFLAVSTALAVTWMAPSPVWAQSPVQSPAPATPPAASDKPAAASSDKPAAPTPAPAASPAAPASSATPPAASTTPAPASPPAADAKAQPADPFGEETTLTARKVLVWKGKATWDTGFETLTDSIKALTSLLAKQNIKAAGPVLIVYTATDDEGFSFQAELPIDQEPKNLPKDMSIMQSPEGKMLKFVHHGSFDNMDNTYEAITNYLDEKKLEARDMFIEEYVTDPLKVEEDKLVINVFVPLK